MNRQRASGGADAPEDVCGALQCAIKDLTWKEDVKARFLVLILDAPCHGTKYHDYRDNYPSGDPHGLDPEDQLRTLRDELGVHVMITEVPHSGLGKMLDIFSVCWHTGSV